MKRWGRTILGTLVVLSGVGAAVITVAARRSGDWELTRLGAVASLVFAVLIVIFVVPPLARSARAEAARLDLAFQVTAGGVVFVSIYTVVAFAAWNTGNNLLFLVFSVLSSTLFVALTAGRASLRDLVVTARFPDHIFAGDPAPVIVTVHNTKRLLPSLSVVVEARERADAGAARRGLFSRRGRERKRVLAYFMYVPHRARVEQRVEQTFPARGRVLVTGFELSTRFPFGFFRLRRRLRARDVEIVVYPKPEGLGDELHLLPIDAGQIEAERRGAGHDLHSLREYHLRRGRGGRARALRARRDAGRLARHALRRGARRSPSDRRRRRVALRDGARAPLRLPAATRAGRAAPDGGRLARAPRVLAARRAADGRGRLRHPRHHRPARHHPRRPLAQVARDTSVGVLGAGC
jgi:hypothetical protein